MARHVTLEEVAPGVHQARAAHVSWVLVTDGTAVTLVDTGYPGDWDRLTESLAAVHRSVADVVAVLLTHGHPDHLGSAERLRTTFGRPVHAHRDEEANARGSAIEQVGEGRVLRMAWRPRVLRWGLAALRLGGGRVDRLRGVETFTDGPLDVPGRPVAVHTPGHTSGHCAFHLPDRGVLLAGDALMTAHATVAGTGPRLLPDHFNTDTGLARSSLRRLADLEADVVVPGHGPPFRGTPAAAVSAALRS